jgi:hypothetical protein
MANESFGNQQGSEDRANWATASTQRWPRSVRPISTVALGLLGLDGTGRLYWNGRRILTAADRPRVTWMGAAAMIGAMGAFISGFAAAIRLLW